MMKPVSLSGGSRSRGQVRISGNTEKPLISIVTVVFNGAHVLENAIRSVAAQTYPEIEYLVIDGGSTDGTVDLLRRYDHSIDHWISERDQGIYDAMNKALTLAHGDWIYFLGADDILLPILDRVAPALVAGAVCYGNVRFAGNGQIYDGSFSRYKIMQQNISHQAIFYPRSIYSIKHYDVKIKVFADYKYNIELMGSGVPFVFIPETICVFEENGQSSQRDNKFLDDLPELIKKNLGWPFYFVKLCRNQAVKNFKGSALHLLVRRIFDLLNVKSIQ